jgi:hypothetical protein
MNHFVENQHDFYFLVPAKLDSTFVQGRSVCLQWMHPSVQEEHLQLEASVGIDKTTTVSWSNAVVVAQYFHVETFRLLISLVRC